MRVSEEGKRRTGTVRVCTWTRTSNPRCKRYDNVKEEGDERKQAERGERDKIARLDKYDEAEGENKTMLKECMKVSIDTREREA